MTHPLSPAAQAVKDAPTRAAALRALADHAPNGRPRARWISASEILDIATELEGSNG